MRAEDHQRAQPDVGRQPEADDQRHGQREQEVGREGGQELGHGLDLLGELGPQADGDANGNPDQRRQHQQNGDPRKGEQAVAAGFGDVAPV